MPSLIFRLLILGIILLSSKLYAQDKIYMTSGVTACNIIDVTTTVVTYLPLKSSKSVTIYVNKVLFLFNEKGMFLQPGKLDFSLKQTEALVKMFLLDENLNLSSDRIYKTDNTIIEAEISKEDKSFVYVNAQGKKIDKKSIAAIVYKDGRHQIIGKAAKAAEILSAAGEKINKSNDLASLTGKKDVSQKTDSPSTSAEKTTGSSSSKSTVEEQISPAIKTIEAPGQDITVKPAGEKEDSVTPTVPAAKPAIKDFLSAPLIADFEKKSKEKTTQFSNYLKIICNKQKELEEINKAIEQALLLFVNEDATIEVSSLNKAPVKHKIKSYLAHLKLLNYDKVELVWTNVQYVTDIKKSIDGNYYGTITFEQEFKGYRDGKLLYSDVTIKKSVVILKTYEKMVEGNAVILWDVLLGDIGVEATRAM